MLEICFCTPVMKTNPQAITRTTTVLIAVARLESTPLIPIFARIEGECRKQCRQQRINDPERTCCLVHNHSSS